MSVNASKLVDHDPIKVKESINLIKSIKKYDKNIEILPAHDYDALETLPVFPEFVN